MPILLPPSSELSVCPELAVCPVKTTKVIPLSAALPVMGVAIFGVCGQHTPSKKTLSVMISLPASLYCVLCHLLSHCSCILLVPQLILSLPSVPISMGPVSLQLHWGWRIPVSAANLRDPDSASARRPSGSTLAPSSLVSTVARQSTSSTGLPRPSGSTLVGHQLALASGLHSSDFGTSLCPSGSSLPPAPLRLSGSPPAPRSPEPSALPWPSGSSPSRWPCGSPSPPWAPLPLAPQL